MCFVVFAQRRGDDGDAGFPAILPRFLRSAETVVREVQLIGPPQRVVADERARHRLLVGFPAVRAFYHERLPPML